jgi:hypothetical protein
VAPTKSKSAPDLLRVIVKQMRSAAPEASRSPCCAATEGQPWWQSRPTSTPRRDPQHHRRGRGRSPWKMRAPDQGALESHQHAPST